MDFNSNKVTSGSNRSIGQQSIARAKTAVQTTAKPIFDIKNNNDITPNAHGESELCGEIFGFQCNSETKETQENTLDQELDFWSKNEDFAICKEAIAKLSPQAQKTLNTILQTDKNKFLEDALACKNITKQIDNSEIYAKCCSIEKNNDISLIITYKNGAAIKYTIDPKDESTKIDIVQTQKGPNPVETIVTSKFNCNGEKKETITSHYTDEGANITVKDEQNHIIQENFYKDRQFNKKRYMEFNFETYNGYTADYHPTTEKTQYFDKNWNLLRTETTTQNEYLKDCPTRTVTYPDGKTEVMQYGSYDTKSGAKYVEKHFESSEGIKTDYTYEESPDNIRITNYKIYKPEGMNINGEKEPPEVLMEYKYTWQQLSDNHIISTANNHVYDILIEENTVTVTDKETNEKNSIQIPIEILQKNGNIDEQKKILTECIKIIPGNQMFMLKNLKSIVYNNKAGKDNAHYYPGEEKIELGPQTQYSLSEAKELQVIFLHEYGHTIDWLEGYKNGIISNNKEIQKIYEEELTKFKQNSTSLQQSYLDHMISDGFGEGVGDTNSILYGDSTYGQYGLRMLLFQKDFPRTITAISKELQKNEVGIQELREQHRTKTK